MTASPQTSSIVIEATGRQELLERVVEHLRGVLGTGERAGDGMVTPWQVSAETFEPLPRRLIESIVDLCSEHDGACHDIELQGYMETDTGPRAWGTVVLSDASSTAHASLEGASIVLDATGERLSLGIHPEGEEGRDV